MAPSKMKATQLSMLSPTPDEIAEARAIIASAADPKKKERACMASMAHWLKNEGCTQNGDALSSRGTDRKRFLEAFMVYQAREKKARVEQTTSRKVGQENRSHVEKGWFSYEYVKGKVGEKKLDAWIAAKQIPSRPDKRTGSDDKEMCDYYYEAAWDSETGLDSTTTAYDVQGQALDTSAATTMMNSMVGDDTTAPAVASGPGVVPIKIEEVNSMDARVKQLTADASPTLNKFQCYTTEVKKMKAGAETQKYQESFAADLGKFVGQLGKATQMLEVMVTGGKYDASKVKDLLVSLDKLAKEYDSYREHAVRFGLVTSTRPRRSRKP